jgi:SAM-dependent methyltransferase
MQESPIPETDQGAIWNYFQNECPASFAGAGARLGHLARRARAAAPDAAGPARVLNVGVGDGTFEELATGLGLEVSCLDPDERAVARIASRLDLGDRARAGSADAMPFADASFDVVVASEVLEHLVDDVLDGTLAEVRRVLAEGGTFLGTVPAREDLAAGQVVCPSCTTRFHRWGHVHSFRPEELEARLATVFGSVRSVERPFVDWGGLNWRGRTVLGLKVLLNRLGVHGSGEFLCFEARGRTGAREGV